MGMILALDLGSARIGRVKASPSLPIRPSEPPQTIPVNEEDLGAAVDACLSDLTDVERVVIEHASFYVPAGAGVGKILALQKAHEVCSRILERLLVALAAHGFEDRSEASPTPARAIDVIPRASWAHRVCPGTRGGVTTAMANAGLAVYIGEGVALTGQDQRDAAGCIVWALFPPSKRSGRYRYRNRRKRPKLTTAERLCRRRASWLKSKRKRRGTAERLAGTCNCGPGGEPKVTRGRHKRGCAVTAPAKIKGMGAEGLACAAKALDRLFSRA